MAVVRPVQWTDFNPAEFDANRPVNEDTVRKLIYAVNMLRALAPRGKVQAIAIDKQGVPLPVSTVWVLSNGQEITEPTTPFNGPGTQNTPDMTDRFIRGGGNTTTAGNEAGGQATINLNHAHSTDDQDAPDWLEDDGDKSSGPNIHSHGIQTDMGDYPMNPAHLQVAFYLKVN